MDTYSVLYFVVINQVISLLSSPLHAPLRMQEVLFLDARERRVYLPQKSAFHNRGKRFFNETWLSPPIKPPFVRSSASQRGTQKPSGERERLFVYQIG